MDGGVRLVHIVLFYTFNAPRVGPGEASRSDRELRRAHPLGVLDRVNRCALLSSTDPNLFRSERALQTSEARWIASLRC